MASRTTWGLFGILLAACGGPAPPAVVDVPAATVSIPQAAPPTPVATADAGAAPDHPSTAESYLRRWADKSRCDDFDYGKGGGIKTFWCHRPDGLELADVAKLAGVDIYSSPASKTDFGHYNPAFVQWLVDNAAPSPRESVTRAATQAAFDAHLRPLAEIFYYTLQKARAEPACFDREKTAYAGLIANKKLPADYYERWFYFMNPAFCEKAKAGIAANAAFNIFNDHGFDAGVDGNVTKSVIGFWLRRSMDGTMDSFADGLHKVLASYLPELVEHPYRPPPAGRVIEGMLDKAATKAQTCSGSAKRIIVNISVQPVGDFDVAATIPAPVVPGARFRPKIVRGPGDPQAECVKQAFTGNVPAFDGGKIPYQRIVTYP